MEGTTRIITSNSYIAANVKASAFRFSATFFSPFPIPCCCLFGFGASLSLAVWNRRGVMSLSRRAKGACWSRESCLSSAPISHSTGRDSSGPRWSHRTKLCWTGGLAGSLLSGTSAAEPGGLQGRGLGECRPCSIKWRCREDRIDLAW